MHIDRQDTSTIAKIRNIFLRSILYDSTVHLSRKMFTFFPSISIRQLQFEKQNNTYRISVCDLFSPLLRGPRCYLFQRLVSKAVTSLKVSKSTYLKKFHRKRVVEKNLYLTLKLTGFKASQLQPSYQTNFNFFALRHESKHG